MWKKRLWILFAILLAACGNDKGREAALPAGSVVLALGDSITAGVGANPQEAWPALLARESGWQVVNGGVSGDDSAQALARLPALLDAHRPALVLVSIGGNDFLRRQPESATRANIEAILATIAARDSRTVLIAIPAPGLGAALGMPSDHALYADLAEKHRVPLLAGAWGEVMRDSRWMSDQVHPNAQGYAEFAARLQTFLRAQGLLP
ncbi:MAG: arylesterase [Cardiobacteriaceae bacterium]|nr:arylesterase [Cardiobacteriaceae bacterium]